MSTGKKVSITVNGATKTVPQGTYDLRTFARAAGLSVKTAGLTLTEPAPRPSNIGGNDSFDVRGGESFVSTVGV